ncbi:hypothetical protein FRB90_008344 [Tulasnella sp. 427]|nr:hypothetical protein FRB90_008344 [Tulasnella sp. 427]
MLKPSLPPLNIALVPLNVHQYQVADQNQDLHGWVTYIHPSGGSYYYHPYMRVVTPVDLQSPQVSNVVLQCAQNLWQRLEDWETALHSEICILSVQDGTVRYYMVDHGARCLFWVHETMLEELQLPPPETLRKGYLASLLLPYYWAHVEHHPEAGASAPEMRANERELISTLLLGQLPGRRLTPFGNETAMQMIRALNSIPRNAVGGFRMASVGRLWKQICEFRHDVNYNERANIVHRQRPVAADVVQRRRFELFNWFFWLQNFIPHLLAGWNLSDVGLGLYTCLLVWSSEHLNRDVPFRSKLLQAGLHIMALALAVTFYVPEIPAGVNAWAVAAGLQRRWNLRLLVGLMGFNIGLYLHLLRRFITVLGSPERFPSASILVEVDSELGLKNNKELCPIPVATWECNVHPEGDKYLRHVQLRTITPVSPQNLAAGRIQAATPFSEVVGPAFADGMVETYLNNPEDGKNTVQYYYVDHRNRQVFRARATSTVELGLEPFDCDGFLKSALTGEYWNHVENFPCHQVFWSEAEDELKGILARGAIGRLDIARVNLPMERTGMLQK